MFDCIRFFSFDERSECCRIKDKYVTGVAIGPPWITRFRLHGVSIAGHMFATKTLSDMDMGIGVNGWYSVEKDTPL